MTADHVVKLFEQAPSVPNGLIWLADQLLVLGQHADALSLEATDGEFLCRVGESTATIPPPCGRLFRPLLARLGKAAADESGVEFQPYGGRYELRRAGESGPVRLDVAIANTPGEQKVRVKREVLSLRSAPGAMDSTRLQAAVIESVTS
jgi:hypothetical protein